jgi:thiosulfate/3-mercaptopyruvate sulfurtransferase
MAEALVSTQWVADNLDNIRLIEIDVDTRQYKSGHIPGAVGFDWQSQLQDQVNRDIIDRQAFAGLLGSAGVTPDTHVVVYGDHSNWFAAYGFWLLKYYGHGLASLMDGGRKKWLDEGRPTTTEKPDYAPTSYPMNSVNADLRASRDYVLERLKKRGFSLVDVRSTPEFTGEVIAPPGMSETAQRAGHIPGAINVPWSTAVTEEGTFKSRQDLQKLYGTLEKDADEIVTYCRIGERSSHTWFALKYILGYENVRNYDGSWTEWGNLIGAPIEKP